MLETSPIFISSIILRVTNLNASAAGEASADLHHPLISAGPEGIHMPRLKACFEVIVLIEAAPALSASQASASGTASANYTIVEITTPYHITRF